VKLLKITSLESGWHDRDEILLHAVFQTLVDFMEKEHVEAIAWDADEPQRKAWAELTDIYKWWKEVRPKRVNPPDDAKLGLQEMVDEYYQYEQRSWDEDQNNLHRLINVRHFMWT